MDKEYRISAGAIVINREKILLVKHNAARHGRNFLVGPGGRVESNESISQGVIREVKEETGLDVHPDKILFVEDLISLNNRVVKIWFLCHLIGGELMLTPEAVKEGIIQAGWYDKVELQDEIIFPSILASTDWIDFYKDNWETKYIESIVDDIDL